MLATSFTFPLFEPFSFPRLLAYVNALYLSVSDARSSFYSSFWDLSIGVVLVNCRSQDPPSRTPVPRSTFLRSWDWALISSPNPDRHAIQHTLRCEANESTGGPIFHTF
jgi:hypothetical protein